MTEDDVQRIIGRMPAEDQQRVRGVLAVIDDITAQRRASLGLPPIPPIGCIEDIEFLPPEVLSPEGNG